MYVVVACRFIHKEKELNEACQDLQQHGNPQSAWDLLAPGTEQAEDEAEQEGPASERPMDPADIQANFDNIVQPPAGTQGEIPHHIYKITIVHK